MKKIILVLILLTSSSSFGLLFKSKHRSSPSPCDNVVSSKTINENLVVDCINEDADVINFIFLDKTKCNYKKGSTSEDKKQFIQNQIYVQTAAKKCYGYSLTYSMEEKAKYIEKIKNQELKREVEKSFDVMKENYTKAKISLLIIFLFAFFALTVFCFRK